ncbi:LysR family transcriptional regulator [Streptomyces mirabilis]|jgi:DNA-binding transcriptional LysR family regulator|uniref:DNA-binding transcriptional regulator, LysR family n=1 Tax=Streptomyces mirabilis TaxID=68239 RepID=A0A1I2XXU0_9ACTN|nr:LysR family transcriptional regulator [Streptomyces mirabilis]SFH16901.1 DNA-binding transcriptional regulator, LysR family [Streptomyces mirabilis]
MELRELRAFVAVMEEGGLSAAARRLHVSQPALSQTVSGLERQLGVKLLVRGSTGVRATEAGTALLPEARAVLARHDQALGVMALYTGPGGGALRIGIPLELPTGLLDPALAELSEAHPDTRVQARHLSTAEQLAALRAGELDVGFLRERPAGPELDALLVVREKLGVLLAAEQAAELAGPDGIALDALVGLQWVGFPRSGSPAWYDELTAILRGHGLDLGPEAPQGQALIAEVKLAAVASGKAFTLAPPGWQQPLPDHVTWSPLVGHPLVRRTWAVWPADSHRRDLGRFVAALDRSLSD